jgi:hypothetical protein
MLAQFNNNLGPGVPTHSASDIGTRGGDPVDLRFYADASAIYDTGLQPYAVDSKGNLVVLNGLYGEEATLGAYGVHQWEHAQLGLDYRGTFRHYSSKSSLDGSDQRLALGYTVQTSKRLFFDMKGTAGTISQGVGAVTDFGLPVYGLVDRPGLLLFDDRVYFGEGGVSATYLLSAHTSVTAGGEGFLARYQAPGLVGLNGYSLRGSLQHRLTRRTTVGAMFEHLHFDYPSAFGQSDINTYEGFWATQLSKYWTFSLQAGVFQAEVQGLQQVAVDPVIAALLGVSTTTQTFYARRIFPAGEARLTRKFHRALLSLSYSQYVTPGNGVYLASRQDSGEAALSYTGSRKLSFTVSGGEFSYKSVGQNLQTYIQANGGAGFTYTLARALHLTARYDLRHQDIQSLVYNHTSYRATIGLAFSPGPLPLSLW